MLVSARHGQGWSGVWYGMAEVCRQTSKRNTESKSVFCVGLYNKQRQTLDSLQGILLHRINSTRYDCYCNRFCVANTWGFQLIAVPCL